MDQVKGVVPGLARRGRSRLASVCYSFPSLSCLFHRVLRVQVQGAESVFFSSIEVGLEGECVHGET